MYVIGLCLSLFNMSGQTERARRETASQRPTSFCSVSRSLSVTCAQLRLQRNISEKSQIIWFYSFYQIYQLHATFKEAIDTKLEWFHFKSYGNQKLINLKNPLEGCHVVVWSNKWEGEATRSECVVGLERDNAPLNHSEMRYSLLIGTI